MHLDRGQRERLRRERAIDGGGQLGHGPSRRGQERVGGAPGQEGGQDAVGLREATQDREVVALARMRDEQDGAGAVLARVDDLVRSLRVVVRLRAAKRAGRIVGARIAGQHDHDAIPRRQPRVVVVLQIGRGDAVAGEHDLPLGHAVGGDGQRREVRAEREGPGRGRAQGQRVDCAEPRAGGHAEGLQIGAGVAAGPQTGRAEEIGDVARRAVGARGARSTTVHLRRGEPLDLVEHPLGPGQRGCRRLRDAGDDEKEDGDQPDRHLVHSTGSPREEEHR